MMDGEWLMVSVVAPLIIADRPQRRTSSHELRSTDWVLVRWSATQPVEIPPLKNDGWFVNHRGLSSWFPRIYQQGSSLQGLPEVWSERGAAGGLASDELGHVAANTNAENGSRASDMHVFMYAVHIHMWLYIHIYWHGKMLLFGSLNCQLGRYTHTIPRDENQDKNIECQQQPKRIWSWTYTWFSQ